MMQVSYTNGNLKESNNLKADFLIALFFVFFKKQHVLILV